MNREAVALGTPVYTIFSGEMGAVDEKLITAGKLRELSSAADLKLHKRRSKSRVQNPRDPAPLVEAVLSARD
jgi:predicted glycosyltransferase